MITATSPTRHPIPLGSWQRDFAEAVTDPAELLGMLGLGDEWLAAARAAAALFPLRVPRSFIARMRHGDATDPLLRQVLPLAAELDDVTGFVTDPNQETAFRLAPGLLRKYSSRALLIATEACALHCRYCFRREFPYDEQQGETGRWNEAVSALAADRSITELILSGGDPLSVGNARLRALSSALEHVTHLESLRLHTRNAVVLPSRIDQGFIEWIRALRWRVTIVLHVNHPNEIAAEAIDALERLRGTGALLLNQSTLLRGVNDDAPTLAELSRRLHRHGVLPYYLHLLDRVRGSAHFEVADSTGKALIETMAQQLPGYLVPKLVREVAGAEAKTVIAAGLSG
ncbi:MAG: EF-P beta-lysylation protein EpmB [Gammaproteobacteria bacterium]|jgi:EF-P beta-lysylation protein EpmB|nr:EF-P beta-lysylation protein EpmB [Gammaproteobacteria bacterium]NDB16653.1 EF-P beta-lysylation protein EpmB [Gammaproteobacteria bacterium]